MSTKRQPKPEPKRTESGLRRVQVFVEEYLVDLNAARAAEVAGFSPKTARYQGKRLLRRPDVQEAVAAAMAARVERTQVTQDEVVREYARIAFADVRQVVSWAGGRITLRDSADVPADAARAIAEVVETDSGLRIKMHGKTAALDALAKHLGMFVDRHEVTGAGGGPVQFLHELTDDELIARLKAKRGQ
jgi:phage terminase small subunit